MKLGLLRSPLSALLKVRFLVALALDSLQLESELRVLAILVNQLVVVIMFDSLRVPRGFKTLLGLVAGHLG